MPMEDERLNNTPPPVPRVDATITISGTPIAASHGEDVSCSQGVGATNTIPALDYKARRSSLVPPPAWEAYTDPRCSLYT